MEEILNVQAHDSEILCLEYSKPETGERERHREGRGRTEVGERYRGKSKELRKKGKEAEVKESGRGVEG